MTGVSGCAAPDTLYLPLKEKIILVKMLVRRSEKENTCFQMTHPSFPSLQVERGRQALRVTGVRYCATTFSAAVTVAFSILRMGSSAPYTGCIPKTKPAFLS